MAPDLNSVPASPRNHTLPAQGGPPSTSAQASHQSSNSASRRASQIYPMSPPPLPLSSPGGTVPATSTTTTTAQHTHAFPPLSPGMSGQAPSVDAAGVPMRHPRPLTAAELHLELEKEQEAVVNRLTRELSALRAHSASVASTASSGASGAVMDGTDPNTLHAGSFTGPSHPTSARRHRSSSSVSRNSVGAPLGMSHTSGNAPLPHRYSVSSQPTASDPSGMHHGRSASVVSTPRYEEVAHFRQELEDAKKENEQLKHRIRELERMIRGGDTDSQRGRRGAPAQQNNGVNRETSASANAATQSH